jgi:hypothetical protein
LISNVQKPKKPFMTNPAMMHLISEMPEPAAYGAKDLTSVAAVNAKKVYRDSVYKNEGIMAQFSLTYRRQYVYYIIRGLKSSPPLPLWTPVILTPTAEVLVEVKRRCAVAYLHIGEPFCDDVEKCGVEADRSAD